MFAPAAACVLKWVAPASGRRASPGGAFVLAGATLLLSPAECEHLNMSIAAHWRAWRSADRVPRGWQFVGFQPDKATEGETSGRRATEPTDSSYSVLRGRPEQPGPDKAVLACIARLLLLRASRAEAGALGQLSHPRCLSAPPPPSPGLRRAGGGVRQGAGDMNFTHHSMRPVTPCRVHQPPAHAELVRHRLACRAGCARWLAAARLCT